MRSKTGYTVVAIGSLVTFGGLLQVLRTFQSGLLVLAWGVVTLLGVFVLARGIASLLGENERADPNPRQAPSKTDDRFGRR